jgi:putative sugar O-methyltransferase
MVKYLNFLKKISNYIKNIIRIDLLSKSRSENSKYKKIVEKAILNSRVFNNFKREKNYNEILEHSTFEEGKKYIKFIQRDNPSFLNKINSFKENDLIGRPKKYYYPEIKIKISPTTLRYIKVASDLKKYFKNLNLNIIEIGCGYGGQFLIISKIFKIKSYLLIDLPIVNKLIAKYLKYNQIKYNYKIKDINEIKNNTQKDLVISNYAFSELPTKIQIFYLENIIKKSKHGYMTMNSGLKDSFFKNHLSIDKIKKILPGIKIIKEEPLTAKNNYIIIWGTAYNL